MAVKKRGSFLQFLHFLLRFIGLNGLVAVAVGAFIWQVFDEQHLGVMVAASGGCAIALALLGEVHGLALAIFSNRGFAGINGLFQVAMAAALFIGGNVFAFMHYQRIDCTASQSFTLAPELKAKLADLRGETDIIIFLQHVSFGQRVELRQDEYDQAAEKIIVEKVKDLAEQFQEMGPRFRVQILDTQKKNANERKNEIKVISEDLADAIEKAPEDSIFFYSRDTKQVQRLSFNDIYQLDKKASTEANKGRGNLVLNYQGAQNFADKVFKIEEKKPRIGFAVVHGYLGQNGTEDIGMPGLKEALAKRGYEGRDIVLRKWPQRDPAALEYEESRFEVLEARKSRLEREIKAWADEMVDDKKEWEYWRDTKAAEIAKKIVLVRTLFGARPISRAEVEAFRKSTGEQPATREITEDFRADWAKELGLQYESYEQELENKQKRLARAVEEQSKLRVDNLAEQRRITDVRDKMKRLLADVDMLVVPRATYFNLLRGDPSRGGDAISPRAHELEEAHLQAIKDFLKSGKPALFCLGPIVEPGGPGSAKVPSDSLEKMLAEFNIELPNQMILYNSEGEALAETEEGELQSGRVEIPPLDFDWKLPRGSRLFDSMKFNAASPVRASMRMTAHGLGEKSREGLKIRHVRPVYVARKGYSGEAVGGAFGAFAASWPMGSTLGLAMVLADRKKEVDEKATILMTGPDSWNEEKPFPAGLVTPTFKRVKSDDPTKGTLLEERRGPFPVGVALEAEVPKDWFETDSPKDPVKVRLAVIGNGNVFIGEKLPAMREKLFLDVTNWLLGRENLLARDNETWHYPRVEVSKTERKLWITGVCFALPLVFLYLGVMVWLVRRMR